MTDGDFGSNEPKKPGGDKPNKSGHEYTGDNLHSYRFQKPKDKPKDKPDEETVLHKERHKPLVDFGRYGAHYQVDPSEFKNITRGLQNPDDKATQIKMNRSLENLAELGNNREPFSADLLYRPNLDQLTKELHAAGILSKKEYIADIITRTDGLPPMLVGVEKIMKECHIKHLS